MQTKIYISVSYFSHCYDEIPVQDNLRKDCFMLYHSLQIQSVHHGGEGMTEVAGGSLRLHSGTQLTSFFPIQSTSSAHGTVLPIFTVALPSKGKRFWTHSHRHLQRSVSMGTLNLINLIATTVYLEIYLTIRFKKKKRSLP